MVFVCRIWCTVAILTYVLAANANAQPSQADTDSASSKQNSSESPQSAKKPSKADVDDDIDEDPTPPRIVGTEKPPPPKAEPIEPKRGLDYPIERHARPLTLLEHMLELRFEAPIGLSPGRVGFLTGARYGLRKTVELAADYSLGVLDRDGGAFGKTFVPGVVVRITDHLGVQAALPILFDPTSLGLSLGAPFKIRLFDKLTVFGGRDLVRIRLKRFVPTLGDPRANEAQAEADAINTILSRGQIRVIGGVIVQVNKQWSIVGEGGVVAEDFSNKDPIVPIYASAYYSPNGWLDLGGRLGFDDLGTADDSFTIGILAAMRL